MSVTVESPAIPDGLAYHPQRIGARVLDALALDMKWYWLAHPETDTGIAATPAARFFNVAEDFGRLTLRLIDHLQIPRSSILFVHVQQPGSVQPIYVDGANTVTLYGAGSGSYDFAPSDIDHTKPSEGVWHSQAEAEAALTDHFTIDVNAGDIIVNALPNLIHRGRNDGPAGQIGATFLFDGPMPAQLLS